METPDTTPPEAGEAPVVRDSAPGTSPTVPENPAPSEAPAQAVPSPQNTSATPNSRGKGRHHPVVIPNPVAPFANGGEGSAFWLLVPALGCGRAVAIYVYSSCPHRCPRRVAAALV